MMGIVLPLLVALLTEPSQGAFAMQLHEHALTTLKSVRDLSHSQAIGLPDTAFVLDRTSSPSGLSHCCIGGTCPEAASGSCHARLGRRSASDALLAFFYPYPTLTDCLHDYFQAGNQSQARAATATTPTIQLKMDFSAFSTS